MANTEPYICARYNVRVKLLTTHTHTLTDTHTHRKITVSKKLLRRFLSSSSSPPLSSFQCKVRQWFIPLHDHLAGFSVITHLMFTQTTWPANATKKHPLTFTISLTWIRGWIRGCTDGISTASRLANREEPLYDIKDILTVNDVMSCRCGWKRSSAFRNT